MHATLITPRVVEIDVGTGTMSGRTGVKESVIGNLRGLFADEAAFDRLAAERGGETAYFVHEFRPDRVAPQEIVFGTSTLYPGRVGSEFFMTRGHIHRRADRPEIYICQRGRGVMHMEAPDGRTHPLEMTPGAIVYVPAYWIHRSVNVGDEPLITVFSYPADAGQDYGIIERSGGMRTLIVDDGSGRWTEADNPRYRPRTAAENERYFAA